MKHVFKKDVLWRRQCEMTVTTNCKVVITAKGVEGLNVTPASMTLKIGKTGQVTPTVSQPCRCPGPDGII